MSNVVIQHLETIWTKASRGGEGARQRNLLPLALELPHFSHAGQFCLQHVTFAEQNLFQPSDRIVIAESFAELKFRVVALNIDNKALHVRFYRDSNNAAKPTNYSFKNSFDLLREQWGRIAYNGRYTDFDTSDWWYEKHVYNIGWFQCLERDRFLKTQPNAKFQELAWLR